MQLLYLIDNLLDATTLASVSSEDTPYIAPNLYNKRPSKPFWFDGVGVVGNPEWICMDFPAPQQLTFAAIFNHNLTTLQAAGDELALKGCSSICSGCNWDSPNYELDISGRIVADFKNLFQSFDQTYGSFRIDFIDQNNPDGFIEVGELVVGIAQEFSSYVHLSPGRDDGPIFHMGNQQTWFGQDWIDYLSEAERLHLKFTNLNNPAVVDELAIFLRAVQQNGGVFVLVPDDRVNFCYYVMVENLQDYSRRIIYHPDQRELREWTLKLKTLTEGIRLL